MQSQLVEKSKLVMPIEIGVIGPFSSGIAYDKDDPREMPQIEIHFKSNSFFCFNGNVQLYRLYSIYLKHVLFKSLDTTKMMAMYCETLSTDSMSNFKAALHFI